MSEIKIPDAIPEKIRRDAELLPLFIAIPQTATHKAFCEFFAHIKSRVYIPKDSETPPTLDFQQDEVILMVACQIAMKPVFETLFPGKITNRMHLLMEAVIAAYEQDKHELRQAIARKLSRGHND